MTEATDAKNSEPAEHEQGPNFEVAVEIAVRLAVLFLVVALCLVIVAPFIGIVLWAFIFAVAVESPYEALCRLLGGRRGLASVVLITLSLSLLIVPAVLLSETLVTGAQRFAANVAAGDLAIPPPPAGVEDWPVIGDRLHEAWQLASENLGRALERVGPQLAAISKWLLGAAGSVGVAMLQLAGSLIIAGFLLPRARLRKTSMTRLASRLVGERGPEFAELAQATVRSVVQGIVGVAVIQATLGGIGFIVVDVPGAGLWALLVLIAAVVQIPVTVVMIAPVLLVFSSASTPVAVGFTIWCVLVGSADNVLKPLLFGRGLEVPMVVILLGAIGGMLAMGIIGLFLGAVILTLGYELFVAWLGDSAEDAPVQSEASS